MNTTTNSERLYSSLQETSTSLSLNIVIVGCGVGGLCAAIALGKVGHKITLVESASQIGEVGAGIQLGPNVTRILYKWGLKDAVDRCVVAPRAFSFRRYATGEQVGWSRVARMEEDYGAPYYHIHRADLHSILLQAAKPYMTLRLNSRVITIDTERLVLTLGTGEQIQAEVVIGADGVHSMLREVVVGRECPPTPTGDAAYRAIIPVDKMLKDPDLRPLVENPEMTGWMGPGRHIMAYCIRGQKEYNMVMIHPDTSGTAEESWTAEVSTEKMRQDFEGWEPRVQKLLSFVDHTLDWKLMDRAPLPTWIHPNGRIALLGDACHPMLPYRAQGAAMAIEDAVVLGYLLSKVSNRRQIKPLLLAYEHLRYNRASNTQNEARKNQKTFHYEDGPEQEARDRSMREGMEIELKRALQADALEGNANMWADPKKNSNQFGFDCLKDAENWWQTKGILSIGNMDSSSVSRL